VTDQPHLLPDPETLFSAARFAQRHGHTEGGPASIGGLYDLGTRAPRPVLDFPRSGSDCRPVALCDGLAVRRLESAEGVLDRIR
jgi:hypothetical protein